MKERRMLNRGLNLEETKQLVKFDQVRNQVAVSNDLKNPDQVVEMSRLRITPELNIEIPNSGTFKLTNWSQKQLGQLLGVQWNKWFDPKIGTHEHVQEEIQRRFTATGDSRKIRTNRFRAGAPGVEGCDGYIRALLSPTYHPIDDERIFDRLEKRFGSQVEGLNFMPNHLSKKSSWGNDHCNHYTVVGQPINMGDIDRKHPDPKVRQIYDIAEAEGALPSSDLVYPGFHMRNSEVGYTAITIDEFNFRLVCLNGMMLTAGESRLMYRQHRPIEDAVLDRQLNDVFEKIPVRWENTRVKMTKLQELQLEHAEKEIEERLLKLEAPKHFRDAAVKAFEKEPLPNMFGVVQAITRAAQEYDDMDKRFEFEALAGRVLQRAAV
jgi:hypothetical protein